MTDAQRPRYEVWGADLNSLYDEHPTPAVFQERCSTYEEAVRVCKEIQNHDTAAWIRDPDTGQIIILIEGTCL